MFSSDFYFDLPKRFIAKRPARPRDSAKLLVIGIDKKLLDRTVKNLPDILLPNDLVIFNDTKVYAATLVGSCRGITLELLVSRTGELSNWHALIKPSKRLVIGDVIELNDQIKVKIIDKTERGLIYLKPSVSDEHFFSFLNEFGSIPLPPYIKKLRPVDSNDQIDYQTIFAKNIGSVAAPTAGLHFTDQLLKSIDKRQIERCTVTLHVGLGTFLPIKAKNIKNHIMHSEWGCVTKQVADAVIRTRKKKGRIISVGTTTLRLLESCFKENNEIEEFKGETNLYIYPGYKFRIVDGLFTNFHLPKSTLFVLTCAFMGKDTMFKAYQHAQENNYRFYSYGDASLLLRR